MVAFRFEHNVPEENAKIKKPTEIAFYSLDDKKRELLPFSLDSLCYYCPPISPAEFATPQFPIDLSNGFESFREYEEPEDPHIDHILDTLEVYERNEGVKTDVDFITFRGMMTKIMTSLYDQEDSFCMNATLYQGTIFIEEDQTAKVSKKQTERRERGKGNGPPPKLAEYWGVKFEALALLKKPYADCTREEIENRNNEQVSNYAQYNSIVRTAFGPSTLLLAGEVDGVLDYKPDDPNEPARWIELKTARPPESPRDFALHEKKLLKFWAQSFLLGVPKIIIGFRNRDGHLLGIEHVNTQSIPAQHQDNRHFRWNGNNCIAHTAVFLTLLKETITGPGIWRIQRCENMQAIMVDKIEDAPEKRILKPSFIAWREELAARTGG